MKWKHITLFTVLLLAAACGGTSTSDEPPLFEEGGELETIRLPMGFREPLKEFLSASWMVPPALFRLPALA